jgi:PAS domain-containing protein
MIDIADAQTGIVVGIVVTVVGGYLEYKTKILQKRWAEWRASRGLWRREMERGLQECHSRMATFDANVNSDAPDSVKSCLRHIMQRVEWACQQIGIMQVQDAIDLDRLDRPAIGFCVELRLTVCNRAALNLFGVEAFDDVRGHNWKGLVEFHTAKVGSEIMAQAREECRPCSFKLIVLSSRTDGKPIMVQLDPVIIPDKHEFGGFRGTVLDLARENTRVLEANLASVPA